MNAINPVPEKIMDVAQKLVQTRGFHGFSFRDISDKVGIRTASIHYYFPTKGDLGGAMLARIQSGFDAALDQIDQECERSEEKLHRFASIFMETFGVGDRLCPFCMFATAQETVPEPVRLQVMAFWDRGEQWLTRVIGEGRRRGEWRADLGDSAIIARTFLSALEGTMVTSRAYQDPQRLRQTADYLIRQMQATPKDKSS